MLRYIKNIFFNKKHKIPKAWCGNWADKNEKKLIIQVDNLNIYSVSILDKTGRPFSFKLLDNNTKTTLNLTARQTKDSYENPILQVEAGSNDIGPTLNLYFLTIDKNGKKRLANAADYLADIFITPQIGLGLYDDLDDDLGVPWALPLDNYFKTLD